MYDDSQEIEYKFKRKTMLCLGESEWDRGCGRNKGAYTQMRSHQGQPIEHDDRMEYPI